MQLNSSVSPTSPFVQLQGLCTEITQLLELLNVIQLGLSCVYPQSSEGLPRVSESGRYSLRLYINGMHRKVCLTY